VCARALVAGALVAGGACAGAGREPKPVATLASSPQAAAAFDAIREAWRDSDATPPAARRAQLERFLTDYPNDGLVPLSRALLALAALAQGDFAAADVELAATERLQAGTANDLRTVAHARRLRLRGEAEAALAELRPLVGKNVDPIARTLFEEELALTALATHRDYEAVSYMDTWLRASPEEDRDQTAKRVAAMVERLPQDVLVGALQAMRSRRGNLGYGADIERILTARLVHTATEGGDAELARILLDPDAGAIVVGDAAVALGELATSRRGLNLVHGRTIGLLLPTESPGLRDEAADVLRGVMWALGLPRGVRNPRARAREEDAGAPPASREACGAIDPAPPLEEPRLEDAVRLVTRDDAGSIDRTEVSLDELAGEGAAVIVAGLDAQTAARALRWGDNHRVPVVALVPPSRAEGLEGVTDEFAFVLGEARSSVIDALTRAAPALATGSVVPVVDASEVAAYPPQGGRAGALTLMPPVSCDIPAVRAGDPRFPIAQWDRDRARAWLVSGSPACARDAVAELSAAEGRGLLRAGEGRPTVALTLEAAALPAHAAGLRVLTAAAGVVPAASAADVRLEELRRFEATLGPVRWWTALGRDAAMLARAAVKVLPDDEATDPKVVASRRTQARDALAQAHARLWTTGASGWEGRTMRRTVCAIDALPGR
jgi:hypothetical protein